MSRQKKDQQTWNQDNYNDHDYEAERKKNEEKWTQPTKLTGHHQIDQHVHYVPEERYKGAEGTFEERMAKYTQNLMKNMKLQIQESQWTPSRINRGQHQNITIKLAKDKGRENPESSKGEVIPHDQKILNKINS